MLAVREILSSLATPGALQRNVRPGQKEEPNGCSLLTLSSVGLGIASVGAGLISIKEDYGFGKLLSGLGIAASLLGMAANMFFRKQDSSSVSASPDSSLGNQLSQEVSGHEPNLRGLPDQGDFSRRAFDGSNGVLRPRNPRFYYGGTLPDHWLN